MARNLRHLLEVQAKLTAELPIHIGNLADDLAQDAPVAVDGKGRRYIPGTSLAGPIRSWWRDAFGEIEEGVFGKVEEKDVQRSLGFASLITVEDAPAHMPEGIDVEIRDGVGIDRCTGVAADEIKYDRQILPAGTTFDFVLNVEVPIAGEHPDTALTHPTRPVRDIPKLGIEAAERRLACLLRALEDGEIHFGAAKSRGLGRLVASDIVVRRHDVATPEGILARLAAPKSVENRWPALRANSTALVRKGRVRIEIHWSGRTAVYNQSGSQGVTIDALPLVSGKPGGDLDLVLTGASLKGALRSQAERICRTLIGLRQGRGPVGIDGNFLKSISDSPLPVALFGSPGVSKAAGGQATGRSPKAAQSRLGLSALSIDDCFLGRTISPAAWRTIVESGGTDVDGAVRAAQTAIDGTAWRDARLAQLVAIDRWTGAAADGLLYNRLEPAKPALAVFRMDLNIDRLWTDDPDLDARDGSEPSIAQKAATVLLLFVLRDLVRGSVPIGFGSTRGLGSIRVDRIVFSRVGTKAQQLGFKDETVETPNDELPNTFLQQFKVADDGWSAFWRRQPSRTMEDAR